MKVTRCGKEEVTRCGKEEVTGVVRKKSQVWSGGSHKVW